MVPVNCSFFRTLSFARIKQFHFILLCTLPDISDNEQLYRTESLCGKYVTQRSHLSILYLIRLYSKLGK